MANLGPRLSVNDVKENGDGVMPIEQLGQCFVADGLMLNLLNFARLPHDLFNETEVHRLV